MRVYRLTLFGREIAALEINVDADALTTFGLPLRIPLCHNDFEG